MATKPTTFVDYAQNANYSIGPDTGQPTKIALVAQDTAEGNISGPLFFPVAEKFNYMQNAHGLWIRWLDEEVFSTEASEFETRLADKASPLDADLVIIESAADGFAKRKVTLANLLAAAGGDLEATLGLGNTSGANNIIMASGQGILGTDGTTGGGLPFQGGAGTTGPGGVGSISGGPSDSGTGGTGALSGGDSVTGAGGGANVIGGEATAGAQNGGPVTLKPGPSAGGTDGTLLFDMPDGTTYTWPTSGGGAGEVLTDAAGDGVLSWAAGGGDLATVLGIDNITDGADIVLSSGDVIAGATGATGVDAKMIGGVGSAGDGGKAIIESGTGSGDPGTVEIRTGALANDKGVEFYLGSTKFFELAVLSSAPTNSTPIGLFVNPDNVDFTFGFIDRTTAGAGGDMNIVAQTATSGTNLGGHLRLWAGESSGDGQDGSDIHLNPAPGTTAGRGGRINLNPAASPSGVDGGVFISLIKTGATQGGAGAAADELWATSSHASLPDNVVLIGV